MSLVLVIVVLLLVTKVVYISQLITALRCEDSIVKGGELE